MDETGAQLAHFSGKMIKNTEVEQKTMAKAHMAWHGIKKRNFLSGTHEDYEAL